MRILIIGASGQVGQVLVKSYASSQEDAVTGTYFQHRPDAATHLVPLDLGHTKAVRELILGLQPEIIYLAGCHTNVDYCETNKNQTWQTNVFGVQNVIQAIKQLKSEPKLVFYSTDYVFDGVEGYYDDQATPYPICEYGKQKLLAEYMISNQLNNYFIIRTNVVYGPDSQKKNYILRMISQIERGERFFAPVDEWITPTYSEDLAEASRQTIAFHKSGTYHIVGTSLTNRFKFAVAAAKIFDCDTRLIEPVTSKSLNRPASRPLNGGLKPSDYSFTISGMEMGLQRLKKAIT